MTLTIPKDLDSLDIVEGSSSDGSTRAVWIMQDIVIKRAYRESDECVCGGSFDFCNCEVDKYCVCAVCSGKRMKIHGDTVEREDESAQNLNDANLTIEIDDVVYSVRAPETVRLSDYIIQRRIAIEDMAGIGWETAYGLGRLGIFDMHNQNAFVDSENKIVWVIDLGAGYRLD